jgi:hypothetical protein
MWNRWIVLLVLMPLLTPSLHAGLLFGRKKDKPDPRQRVPELILQLKTDQDADKRSRAAEELRNYDLAQFPEIVPALIDAVQNDKKPGVRVDALQSLAKLRPVSQAAGEALEAAQAKDPSMRVRLQARSALLQYHWAGYRSAKKADVSPSSPTTSREPPLATPDRLPPPVNTRREAPRLLPTPAVSPYGARPLAAPPAVTTQEPPLAPPPAEAPPIQLTPTPAAPPVAPAAPPVAPAAPPAAAGSPVAPSTAPPAAPSGTGQGPELP